MSNSNSFSERTLFTVKIVRSENGLNFNTFGCNSLKIISVISSVTIFHLGNVCRGKQPPRYCTVIGGR